MPDLGSFYITFGLTLSGLIVGTPFAYGQQVTTDGSLNTTVTPNGLDFVITDGYAVGNQLFHSFDQFSVPVGGFASFDLVNTPSISTIFSRVSGSEVSQINGTLRTLNSSGLPTAPVSVFLLNPNGIVFGPSARLNIGGSFIATTAESIEFSDGSEFSASTMNQPLLTISTPVGLHFGTQSEPIINRSVAGLQVLPGRTLGLVGAGIQLENGGSVRAAHGNIELASVVANSETGLAATSQGWTFQYAPEQGFQDITLSQGAAVDASGIGGGNVQVQGRRILLENGSTISAGTFGSVSGGQIRVLASESLTLRNTLTTNSFLGGIGTYVVPGATGNAGQIWLKTPRLDIENGMVTTGTAGIGNAGDLTVHADEIVMNIDLASAPVTASGNVFTGLFTTVLANSAGQGGELEVISNRISLQNGSAISSGTFSSGRSGDIYIRANFLEVVGGNPRSFTPSNISANIFASGVGQGGDIVLDVEYLQLRDGALVTSSTLGRGSSGNIEINSQRVEIVGVSPFIGPFGDVISSGIRASAEAFSFPGIPPSNGSAGNITINTDQLTLANRGRISVNNLTTGENAGSVNIEANQVHLSQGSAIEAILRSGDRGDINIDANTLILRQGSRLSTNALANASGGNINLNTNFLIALENSDITANAINNFGGRVVVNAQTVLGTAFRPQLTAESDITASSELGSEFSGSVELLLPNVDPGQGLTEISPEIISSDQQVAAQCGSDLDSEFVLTGRGGMPPNPETAGSMRSWSDTRDLSAFRRPQTEESAEMLVEQASSAPLVEASHWQRNAQGEVELVAGIGGDGWQNSAATCG
jgi:filamentous hemagglutinin family protein